MTLISIILMLSQAILSPPLSSGYQIGDQADDFNLINIDGKKISMSNYPDAKGFVIIFTCNHCPYSVAYEDRIIDLNAEYAPKGIQIIAINPNDPVASPGDSYENMVIRAKEKNFTFPYLFDDQQKIYPKFGATRTPHVFLLDKERIVRYIGAIDDNVQDAQSVKSRYLANAINNMLMQKEINPEYTKAIGCTIKAVKK